MAPQLVSAQHLLRAPFRSERGCISPKIQQGKGVSLFRHSSVSEPVIRNDVEIYSIFWSNGRVFLTDMWLIPRRRGLRKNSAELAGAPRRTLSDSPSFGISGPRMARCGYSMREKSTNGFVFVARLGFELVAVTFVCAGIGYFFDSRLGMRIFPALSIIGLLIGGGAGFWLVYRTITRMTEPTELNDDHQDRE